jgi:hypothetical protein
VKLTAFTPELVFPASSSQGPHELYARRDQGPPDEVKNTHPNAAAAWLLLVVRCIESGLSPAKDSSNKVIQMYLRHYIKVLSHVQLECRLSKDEEISLLAKFCPDCPRFAFINGRDILCSRPSPPAFLIPEKISSCRKLLSMVIFEDDSSSSSRLSRITNRFSSNSKATFWYLGFHNCSLFVLRQFHADRMLQVSPPSLCFKRRLVRLC